MQDAPFYETSGNIDNHRGGELSTFEGKKKEEVILTAEELQNGAEHLAGEELQNGEEHLAGEKLQNGAGEKAKICVLLSSSSGGYVWTSQEILEASRLLDYPGEITITPCEKGYYVKNIVDLEEYLLYVVGSEMPVSFGLEALKAQAVCARTYAYMQRKAGSLSAYGADLDDTTKYQAYVITEVHPLVKRAVEETKGQYLSYHGEPIEAYYYSCSGGSGATVAAWSMQAVSYPYFSTKDYGDLEQDAPWHQWSMEVAIPNSELIDQLKERMAINPDAYRAVLDGEAIPLQMVNNDLTSFSRLQNLQVTKILNDCYAYELELQIDKMRILVSGEHEIRQLLGSEDSAVLCQNGQSYVLELLPSSAFCIEEFELSDSQDKKPSIHYILTGSGFGHGIGMSQYGAAALAAEGKDYKEILTYYYENVSLSMIEFDTGSSNE